VKETQTSPSPPVQHRGLLRPLALTAVVFFTVSGGPYGLEPLLSDVGVVPAIILILLTPFLWSIPAILMVLELNAMMPQNGGYYQWVKHSLGPRWGFLEGWWSWLYTFADLAIYPVLFSQYLNFFVPGAEALHLALCLSVVWICVLLNLLGVVPVGRWSAILTASVLIPFVALFAVALIHPAYPFTTNTSGQATTLGSLGLGLFTVMWNYLGWDNASTVAEEVDHPLRSYLTSIFSALILIVVMYLFSIIAGAYSGISPDILKHDGFPSLGTVLGGWWLGALLSLGGMASAVGLFLSTLLTVSRVPKAMADDGFLPSFLGRISTSRRVPHLSVVFCAVIVSGMVLWGFSELIIIDVTLYGAALFLELLSLVTLRIQKPDYERPFRIPVRLGGIVLLALLPAGCWLLALAALLVQGAVHVSALLFAGLALLTGPCALWLMRLTIGATPFPVADSPPPSRSATSAKVREPHR
jgi:amino acid transporter